MELVYQYVKMIIIIMHNSEMLRKFSTKKSWPRNNKLALFQPLCRFVIHLFQSEGSGSSDDELKIFAWDKQGPPVYYPPPVYYY